jgi:3',5'-cyclic-AMP phosphodiesterase
VGTLAGKPHFTADSMSFCGEDEQNGVVRFEERYGYNLYQIIDTVLIIVKAEMFTTGKVIKTVKID